MFKKLFGSSTATTTKQAAQAQIDPMETMNKLSEQIENVQKRSKKIEADMKRLLEEALQKKKAKDNRGMRPIYANIFYRSHIRSQKKEDVGKGSC